jgi:hypothetical protein
MFYVRRHKLRRRLLNQLMQQLRQQQSAASAIALTAVERAMSQPRFRPLAVYSLVRGSCIVFGALLPNAYHAGCCKSCHCHASAPWLCTHW